MKVKVSGCGKLGSVIAGYFASLGHRVFLYDRDIALVESLIANESPFVDKRDLSGCTAWDGEDVDVNVICVNTHTDEDGTFDCSDVQGCLRTTNPTGSPILNVIMSTVVPGFCESMSGVDIVYCPPFMALGDMQFPKCLNFYGTSDGKYRDAINELFEWQGMVITTGEAEVSKIMLGYAFAQRCQLSLKVSEVCTHSTNANPLNVLAAMGNDPRFGSAFFRFVGPPTGPCFPRDLVCAEVLMEQAAAASTDARLGDASRLSDASRLGDAWQRRLLDDIIHAGLPVVICGLSYKANVPYTFASLGVRLLDTLSSFGTEVRGYCPWAEVGEPPREGEYVVEVLPGAVSATGTTADLEVWKF